MKKRVISALVIALIGLPIIYLGGPIFYVFSLVIALIALHEILNLILNKDLFVRFITYLIYLALLGINVYKTNLESILDYRVIGICLLLFCLVALFKHSDKEFNVLKLFMIIGVTILLSTSFSAIIVLRNMSFMYFIFLLLIPILNDTFAHSIGSLFGKHKINAISPNKSWEGCLGGLFFGVIGSSIFYLICINTEISIITLVSITFLLSIISQLGDLFFSLIKRQQNIKDFSNLIPGHGGILDRLDSLIFVSLALMFFISYL